MIHPNPSHKWPASFMNKALTAMFLISSLFTVVPAYAGDGHNHGEEAPAASASAITPRFSAHSDVFEAVGLLNGDELSILIDRYGSNEPVLQAKVEVESGSVKLLAAFHADHGDYNLPSAPFKKPGTYAITLTITAGDQTDLLVGELVVPDPEADHAHEPAAR